VLLGVEAGLPVSAPTCRTTVLRGVAPASVCGRQIHVPVTAGSLGRTRPTRPRRFGDATPFALDLIITPDSERGFAKAHFHAWATDRSGFNGRAVTIPPIIEQTTSKWYPRGLVSTTRKLVDAEPTKALA
jgi:hypothetical protein